MHDMPRWKYRRANERRNRWPLKMALRSRSLTIKGQWTTTLRSEAGQEWARSGDSSRREPRARPDRFGAAVPSRPVKGAGHYPLFLALLEHHANRIGHAVTIRQSSAAAGFQREHIGGMVISPGRHSQPTFDEGSPVTGCLNLRDTAVVDPTEPARAETPIATRKVNPDFARSLAT